MCITRILFDFGHPKDINVFKNVIYLLRANGHEVKVVARSKENIRHILDEAGLEAEYGSYYESMIGKFFGILRNDVWLFSVSKRFRPDVFVSLGSPYSAHASWLLGKPHLAYIDTEIATFAIKLMLPFTGKVYTSSSFYLDLGTKQEKFEGYFELAYLHPNYFKPDKNVLEKYGLNEEYIILRLSALTSHHDMGAEGFAFKSESELEDFIHALENHGRVVISSEKELGPVVDGYRLDIKPNDLHSLLYYAKLYIGEGATMASEAAVLGVPSIYVSNTQRGYLNELENKYDLAFTISDRSLAFDKCVSILSTEGMKSIWAEKRDRMLSEKIDINQLILTSIESIVH